MKNKFTIMLAVVFWVWCGYNLASQRENPEIFTGIFDTMPVELIYFTATIDSNVVLLNWGTATEVNNYGFNIERAGEKLDWKKIGFVAGSGTSSSTKHYYFFDSTIQKNTLYYYRLKQFDNDGQYKYSDSIVVNNIVSVNSKQEKGMELYLLNNYPNPFNPSTTIVFRLPKQNYVKLSIYDAVGKLVETLINNQFLNQGEHKIDYINRCLASGVYYYRLETTEINLSKKFVILK